MKTFILSTLLLTFLSFSWADALPRKKELVKITLERLKAKQDLSDVIEDWNRIFDRQNLERDENKDRYNWRENFPVTASRSQRIEGSRTYYKLVQKNYRYTIHTDPQTNQLIVELKLHFYPSKTYQRIAEKHARNQSKQQKYYPLGKDLERMIRVNVKKAEETWNSQAPNGVSFRFLITSDPQQADYSLKLVTIFGALYDRFITAPAPSSILEHEIGHMLGLDDEYALITSNAIPVYTWKNMLRSEKDKLSLEATNYQDMRCYLESIMCLKDKLLPYHFDHILGRLKP